MPGRSGVYNLSGYNMGFNGKWNDKETTTQDYGFRIYDLRGGRFLSVDPLVPEYPELTPYQFSSNRPIDGIDRDGLEYSPASREYSRDATSVKLYPIHPMVIEKQLKEAPSKQMQRVAYQVSRQPQNTFSLAQKPLNEYDKKSHQSYKEQRYAEIGLNSDGSKQWWDNEKFDKAASALVLPALDALSYADGVGEVKALGKVAKLLNASEKSIVNTGVRAFHSGAGTEAKAIEQGFQTLGQTRAGQNLQNLITSKSIPLSESELMWQRLSTIWAKGVPNGSSVPVFLNNPRAGATWIQTELPILQSKNVNIIRK
jgi:RHS repeat-associated protein